MDILAYLLGSKGGGGDEDQGEKYYLYGANDDTLTLPVTVKNTLKITFDLDINMDKSMPGNTSTILSYGGQTTWLYTKVFATIGMYRGNWTYCAVYPGKYIKHIVLDRVNRILSAVGTESDVSVDDSGNNWQTSDNNYVLHLGQWVGYQSIQIEDNGVLAYDLIATVDTDGTPCLKDTLSGQYYYSANGTAVLKTLA